VVFQISSHQEAIMVVGNLFRGVFLILVALVLVIMSLSVNPAQAGEKEDKIVRNALAKRTTTYCMAVLPLWLKSETGIQDPAVRDLVTDCYMGQARLKVLGVKTNFPLETVALSEVPAILIQQETGINLDIAQPLSGRTIRTVTPKNGS
jgi:hypothetical protein